MEENKTQLFRQKSLETIESPESLNDYLRVTSPGVWLVLAAVIALLVGTVLWGIFGRINTTAQVAVVASGEKCVCLVPYDSLMGVVSSGSVNVDSQDYPLDTAADYEVVIISESTNPYTRVTGGLDVGDVAVEVPVEASLPDGVYAGTVITESLRPISMLLQ